MSVIERLIALEPSASLRRNQVASHKAAAAALEVLLASGATVITRPTF